MRQDYFDVKKPSAFSFWWNRHGGTVKFLGAIVALALVGGLN